ncbi:MAG TPA: hypothetical protein VGF94_06370 [Kofleriaceae bacterium]|jgi:hypothetical protein
MTTRRWSVAIFFTVLAVYLLSGSREHPWGDAHPVWDVAERVVHHGAIDITRRWPEDLPAGRDGKYYGIAPIGPVLVQVPGAIIAGITRGVARSYDTLVWPIASHLAPAVLGALACVVFFWLLLDLGRTRRTASLCTAILAFATTTWVYARSPYSEILQLACFVGMFRATWRTIEYRTRREAIWLGVWAGCLLDAKYVYALAIVGAAVAIIWSLRDRRAELRRVLGWATVAGAPFLALGLAYNYARWGSIFETGYGPYLGAFFGGSLYDGATGMLVSPNKSAFLYSPPLVLAMIALPRTIRAQPRYGLLLVTVALPVLVVCCTYRSWSGDYAWGPRFFVYLVPALLVPLAWFVDEMSRAKKAVLGSIVTAGFCVQLLGNALYWDHFIRIAIDAKNQWLGNPNRSGAYVAEAGRGHCDSCFEDTYEIMWTPAFQPIRGHWWLVDSLAHGDDWKHAEDDAPWRRYTTLTVDLSQSYPRTRIDWWGLLWMKDATGTWPLGMALLLLFAGGAAGAGVVWLRLHRAGDGRQIVRDQGHAESGAGSD